MKKNESEQTNRIGTSIPIDKIGIGTRIFDISKGLGGIPGLADVTGISESQLYRYINGKSSPTLEPLVAIARVGKVSLDWLVDGIEPKERRAPPPEPPTAVQEQIVRAFQQFEIFHMGGSPKARRELFAQYWNERQFGPERISEEWVSPEQIREVPDLTAEQIEAWEKALGAINAAKAREERRQGFDEAHGIGEQPNLLYKGVERRRDGEFVYIPWIDTLASAGPEAIEEGQVRYRLAFRRDWIRAMGLEPEHLALVSMPGDSMVPTLAEGDIVLVDRSRSDIQSDGIYALWRDGVLIIKRIQTTITGDIYIRSDNPRYTEERIPKDRLAQLHIFGLAVWLGRKI